MSYDLLAKLYYKDNELFHKTYEKRKNSPYATSLGLDIYGSEAFFVCEPSAMLQTIRIYKKFAKLEKLCVELPEVAYNSYARKCLIDEIILSNDIEGIRSTRKEIIKVLDKSEASEKHNRFDGMVKKYAFLLYNTSNSNDIALGNSKDLRTLYDEMVLDEIAKENWPDGDIFRKDIAEVISGTQQIKHTGLFPESKIIHYVDTILSIFKNDSIPQLYKIAILHYFIGFIHPFYDGNGRLGRFISSYLLKQEFNSLVALRLAYTIKKNKNAYYNAFDVINDSKNMGDLTPFIHYFSDTVEQSMDSLISRLTDGSEILNYYYKRLTDRYGHLEAKERKRTLDVLWYLIQCELFSSDPMDKKLLSALLKTSAETAHHYVEGLKAAGVPIKVESRSRKFIYQIELKELDEYLSK